jgi:hypothetical protein
MVVKQVSKIEEYVKYSGIILSILLGAWGIMERMESIIDKFDKRLDSVEESCEKRSLKHDIVDTYHEQAIFRTPNTDMEAIKSSLRNIRLSEYNLRGTSQMGTNHTR